MMTRRFSPAIAVLKQMVTLPLLAGLILLFSTKILAQENPKTTVPATPVEKSRKDTIKPTTWLGLSIGYTKEGVSGELLNEYDTLVEKIKSSISNGFKNVSKDDRKRMEFIYKQMSLEQQNKQSIGFIKDAKPLPKIIPTKQQYEAFKNPQVYGVWINEKKVSNAELNKYSNMDFSQVFISKLYGAAKKGKTYTHQLNLMTNDFYNKYYEEARAHEDEAIMVLKRNLIIVGPGK